MDLNRQYLTERIRELLHHLNVDVVVDVDVDVLVHEPGSDDKTLIMRPKCSSLIM